MSTPLTPQHTAKRKQVVLENVDISWMEPGKKIWIEQQLSNDSKEDIFLQGILNFFDLPTNEAKYTVASGQAKKELKYIYERADDYTNKDYKGFEDMVNMEIINDAELLLNVATRYKNNLIFTYVGPTLLVVNPFQSIPPLFLPEVKSNYIGKIAIKKDGHYKDLPPHIYAIGAEAYRCLFENQKNQSIVISGESGAGKTENAKYCMNLLTSIGSYGQDPKTMVQEVGIEDKILSCNPILEAFGNAKTLRNNNSSRFGKYVRMKVDNETKKIIGAQIINYLLEKSRITSQGTGERNFHIFYFFMVGLEAKVLEKFHLSKDGQKLKFEYFNYLRNPSGKYIVDAINDKEMFEEIQESIKVLGFSESQFNSIFGIVAAVLLMGNLEFDESTFGNETPCGILDTELLDKIGFLLSLEPSQVQDALTIRQREVQKMVINSPLSKEECQNSRDSWSKELYERLFSWLVVKLNDTIKPVLDKEYIYVGLLDIYGFEVFDVNGFNQLMINYTNEKLHQLYISYVFKEEEAVFEMEDLKQWCCQIKFTDNQMVMDLMDKYPTGIFDLLDESCQVKSDDDQLLQKIRKAHAKNPLLVNPKMISKPSFILVHTAKDVDYSIMGFRERNKDELSTLTNKIANSSKNELVARLFPIATTDQKKDKSLSKKVRSEIQELMKELNKCDVHFVRCIKPNDDKTRLKIVQDYTLKQIRYLGVLDSLKIRKQNYPVRRAYELFYKKYGDMTKNKIFPILVKEKANFKQLTQNMFSELMPQLGPEQVLFGKNRIFIRLEAMPMIDKVFQELILFKNKMATKIQRSWRAKFLIKKLHKFHNRLTWIKSKIKIFREKIFYKSSMDACLKIQRWFKKLKAKRMHKLQQSNILMIQNAIKRYEAIKWANKLRLVVLKLQKFTRMVVKMNVRMKQLQMKRYIQKAIDNAWLEIQTRRAIVIQRFARGYVIRKKHAKQILQIKEVGRQCKLRNVVTCIQKHARGYILRKKLKNMHKAAYFIQGYFRMKWLSALFQTMREKSKVIQYHVRLHQLKRQTMREKQHKYIFPMEQKFQKQKAREENILFGVAGGNSQQSIDEAYQNYERLSSEHDDSTLSPFLHGSSPSKNSINSRPFLKKNNNQDNVSSFDDILDRDQDPSGVNRRIKLFAFLLDLEVFTDSSEYFVDSYADCYKRLFEQNYTVSNYLQTLHVGATHTFATSCSGKVYAWGMNDFGQLGLESLSLRPIKPTLMQLGSRVKQIATGADHTLLLDEDGKVLVCGSNEQGQQLITNFYHSQLKELDLPFVCKQVAATNNTSFILSEDGRIYTWPVGNTQDFQLKKNIQMPIEMSLPVMGSQINFVATGNEFAVFLSLSGQLFSFGENEKGELGLGHNQNKLSPALVNFPKGQKVYQVACGFKHCIAKTTLGKIYTWGWGEFGQLGTGKFQDLNSPNQIDVPDERNCQINQVQASHRSSMILIDNQKILWCGTNATINYQSQLVGLQLQGKCQRLMNNEFSPIRILTSFSRTLSLIYVTYANHRDMFKNHPGAARGVLSTLTQKWIEQSPFSVDPPIIESISKHMSEQHQKIPVKGLLNLKKDPLGTQDKSHTSPRAQKLLSSYKSKQDLSPKNRPGSPKTTSMQFSDIYGEETRSPKKQFDFIQTQSFDLINPSPSRADKNLSFLQMEQNTNKQTPKNNQLSLQSQQSYQSSQSQQQYQLSQSQQQQQFQQQQQNYIKEQQLYQQQQQLIQHQQQFVQQQQQQQQKVFQQQYQQQQSWQQLQNNDLMHKSDQLKQLEQPSINQKLIKSQTLFQDKDNDDASQDDEQNDALTTVGRMDNKTHTKLKKTKKQSQTTIKSSQAYNSEKYLNRLKGSTSKLAPSKTKTIEISPKLQKQKSEASKQDYNMTAKYESNDDQLDTENKQQFFEISRIKKLREIKIRLLALKGVPENKWSTQDHEFLRNIYKSNLSSLLDQVQG